MAKLSSRCSFSFSPIVRERGARYFRQGAVKAFRTDADRIGAIVTGDARYRVALTLRTARASGRARHEILAGCECPHFKDGELCKHLWATLLECDRRSADVRLSGIEPVTVTWTPKEEFASELREDVDDDASEDDVDLKRDQGEPNPPTPGWRTLLEATSAILSRDGEERSHENSRQIHCVLDPVRARRADEFRVSFFATEDDGAGGRTKPHPIALSAESARRLPDARDRAALWLLLKAVDQPAFGYYGQRSNENRAVEAVVPGDLIASVAAALCATGRFHVGAPGRPPALTSDMEEPFAFYASITEDADGFEIVGSARRGSETHPLTAFAFALPSGAALLGDRLVQISEPEAARAWLSEARASRTIRVPASEIGALNQLAAGQTKNIELPAGLRWPVVDSGDPQVRLSIRRERERGGRAVTAHLEFGYSGAWTAPSSPSATIVNASERRLERRRRDAEARAVARLIELGAEQRRDEFRVRAADFLKVTNGALANGWNVRADGREIQVSTGFELTISSGIDWFDLKGGAKFGDQTIGLPELLRALRGGESFIELGDGGLGVLPEQWLRKNLAIADFGELVDGGYRFSSAQALTLSAWADEARGALVDEGFEKLRVRFNTLQAAKPLAAMATFNGELRPYQREGLGWLAALDEWGFGGILADDMGLGKTVQFLAFLDRRLSRAPVEARRPSLIVAPKSLVFNWIDESKRFTPHLRVVNFTGPDRAGALAALDDCDVVITTYSTMRLEIERLRERRFDCVVLDEAQMVKNERASSARAAKLLRANFRLAMTGTPVENSVRDLLSILDFVNPGLVSAVAMRRLGAARAEDAETLAAFSRALRPIVLRRTKQQVLTDLPDKTEMVVAVELTPAHQREYESLRDHLRASMNRRIQEHGAASSQIHILAALLRLRQASLHPGLLDPSRVDEASAKLDALVAHLEKARSEGRRALVFSQFTGLLSIVRRRLDRAGITYLTLDGKTANRGALVSQFQGDDGPDAFLISLKAGGTGLNLTRAECVFLLDPWWNPAAEAQAIDRAYRIGQTKKVFAYKLISQGTVEEKILAMQRSKQRLASALIASDVGFLRSLSADDLQSLFE